MSRNCSANTKCYKYQGRHHSSICGSRAEASNPTGNQVPFQLTYSQRHYQLSTTQSVPQNVPVSTNFYISLLNTNEATLLQTARAHVHRLDDPSKFL